MRTNRIITTALVLLSSSILLSACGQKKTAQKAGPTPTPMPVEMKLAERPYISLTPREDGHLLKLKISNIPAYITHAEYEVIYKAQDQGMEIEKGVGDTIKEIQGGVIEREVLLGTESCTAGCKYKYDDGVTGGQVNLTLLTADGQSVEASAPFILKSSADIKKQGGWKLEDETGSSFDVKATATGNDFFVVLKNYGLGGNEATQVYSVFSSGAGKGKVVSIAPGTITKANMASLSGDYLEK